MSMMMKIMMVMMKMVPRFMSNRLKAPMIKKEMMATGRFHPTIEMNLTNLLLCQCGTCPSFPAVKGEALYCAGGTSSATIEENGCNCVTCPLFDKCSGGSIAYFCIHGECAPHDERTEAAKISDLTNEYLQRFIPRERENAVTESGEKLEGSLPDTEPINVTLNFEGDKPVITKSDIPILQASLDAGIPHTHVCGGRARCSTCRCLITDGIDNCRPRNERETRLANIKGFSPEVRLACQTTVTDDVSLRRLVLDDQDISVAIGEGRTGAGNVGREIETAVMFSDIRSFTSFSEHALPYDVIHILNRYFETIGDIIDSHGGYIDKYMGDGIMVLFGLDAEFTDSPSLLAVKAAEGMIRSLNDFNQYLSGHFNHEFKIGIGIHTGTVIIGNLGFHKKKEFTAIGDTVNTASRIESLNKKTGTAVLVSDAAHSAVADNFKWGKKFRTKVKGKEEDVVVYELVVE